jgi:heme exporter protein B
MHNSARQALTIAVKDLRAELRTKESIQASLSFALVILLLFSFSFDPSEDEMRALSGGLLWIVFAFAGALILNRTFAREIPNDCLDALVAAPLSAAALFLGKAIASFLLLFLMEIVCFPVFGVFYNVRWTAQFWPLLLVLVLATWGFTVIGTVFSALTVNMRLREIMLPLLIYPLMIPCLLAAIRLTSQLVAGQPLDAEAMVWMRLLVGFNIIFTSLALFLVESVLVA